MWMWRHYMECMSIQIVNLHGVWRHSPLQNIHMDTDMDMDRRFNHLISPCLHIIKSHGVWRHYHSLSAIICECGDTTWSVHPYRMSIYMECGDIPHSVISIWIQIWIWTQSVLLVTWSVETLYIKFQAIWKFYWNHWILKFRSSSMV